MRMYKAIIIMSNYDQTSLYTMQNIKNPARLHIGCSRKVENENNRIVKGSNNQHNKTTFYFLPLYILHNSAYKTFIYLLYGSFFHNFTVYKISNEFRKAHFVQYTAPI